MSGPSIRSDQTFSGPLSMDSSSNEPYSQCEDIASRAGANDELENQNVFLPPAHPAGPPSLFGMKMSRVGDYKVGRILGNGVFSTVRMGSQANGRKVAIKIIDKKMISKKNLKNNVRREVSIMKKLCHKNVLGLIDVMASQSRLYLITELMEGGNLQTYVNSKTKLSDDEARFFFLQLIQGLDFCHHHYVWHRDLKPENLLLDATHKTLKISDFGLGMLLDHDNATLQTTCGTPFYVAPEVLRRSGYRGATVDVWSAGCVLFCFLTGVTPFRGETPARLYQQILHEEPSFPKDVVGEDAEDLIRQILVTSDLDRISVSGILAHPWLRGQPQDKRNQNQILCVSNLDLSEAIMEIDDEKPEAEPQTISLLDLVALSGIFDVRSIFGSEQEKRGTKQKYGPRMLLCKIGHEDLVRLVMEVTTNLGYGGQLIKWKWLHIVGNNNATCICITHQLTRNMRIISFGGDFNGGFGRPLDAESKELCDIMHDTVRRHLEEAGTLLS